MDISKLTITEIKKIIKEHQASGVIADDLLAAVASDARQGVQKIHKEIIKKQQQLAAEESRLAQLFNYERELIAQGKQYLAGVDEVGRGPLAGPVVAAAVILPHNIKLYGLNDSKKLTKAKREQLTQLIKGTALCWAIGTASTEEIAKVNIYQASVLAMARAVEGLTTVPDHLLIDAVKIPQLTIPQTPIIGGDGLSASIAAASIIAKTHRDQLMDDYHRSYPQYGFDKHKGYPTPEHLQALKQHGPSPIHRMNYGPVAELLQQNLF
ncbi:ribonuclease HII [Peptococcaceae bacterium 1198_IL3148]